MAENAHRTIRIRSQLDGITHEASFEPVRSAGGMTLGWATVTSDGSYRFPAIVRPSTNREGYSVYTVSDWQAPASSFGDLADPYDWATLTRSGIGKFTNPARENSNPISLGALALPLAPEQRQSLELDFAHLRGNADAPAPSGDEEPAEDAGPRP